ncbi:MAG: HNH endonuclease [Clostridiales bacterium]|nr:HNH endonuclease [Clostridiales bacterium]
MDYIYVLDRVKNPLMPTTRYGKVRRMLADGRAEIVSHVPFTVRLTYEAGGLTQRISAGIDPGRTNIGLAAVREDGACLYLAHAETRNKRIPKLMSERKTHRQASRRGERLARKRLARKLGTTVKHLLRRKLPGCGEPVTVKDIINTEARFNNRSRPEGWLTPTARQLLQTHMNLLVKIKKILPVTDISLELNRFAFMALEDPGIKGTAYQDGPLKGFSGAHEAVSSMQGGKCLLCGKADIEHYHHMQPRHQYGSDTFANLAGLCGSCHRLVHTDQAAADKLSMRHGKRNKKYGALSVLNQIFPQFVKYCEEMFPGHAYFSRGWDTQMTRDSLGIDKSHEMDAYCIALYVFLGSDKLRLGFVFPKMHEIIQFRRHNRARIHHQTERAYKLGKETVAANRHKRTEQTKDSLEEWYLKQAEAYGEKQARKMLSRLAVKKSRRVYNPLPQDRVFTPGDVILWDGERHIITGQKDKGRYVLFYGCRGQFKASECKLIERNAGLVYVS